MALLKKTTTEKLAENAHNATERAEALTRSFDPAILPPGRMVGIAGKLKQPAGAAKNQKTHYWETPVKQMIETFSFVDTETTAVNSFCRLGFHVMRKACALNNNRAIPLETLYEVCGEPLPAGSSIIGSQGDITPEALAYLQSIF